LVTAAAPMRLPISMWYQRIGPDVGYPGTQLVEKQSQLLHVWLRGRVLDNGPASRGAGSHEGVLCTCHAGFVEEDLLSLETMSTHLVAVVDLYLRAQRPQGRQMGIHPSPAYDIPPWRRQPDLAAARKQRSSQQYGGPDASAQLGVQVSGLDVFGVQAQDVLIGLVHVHAQCGNDLHHGADVLDLRHVTQCDLLVGEERGGQHGKRCVLVATGDHGTL
jgi:hypothetical protein